MNKVMLIGRIVRNPEIQSTQSGIKWSRFTVAVNRPFGEEQTDFIPVVAWRNQAEFVENYMKKGSLVSIEGRFTSSTYTNNENVQVTRYEVTVDRVEGLESKAVRLARENQTDSPSASSTQMMKLADENKPETANKEIVTQENTENELENVPWDLDL